MKIKQYNILAKEIESIKKHSSHRRSQVKNTTNINISSSMLKKNHENKRGLSQPALKHNSNNVTLVRKYEHYKVSKPKP